MGGTGASNLNATDSLGPLARALVVDDDPNLRDFLSRVLTDLGLAVQTAQDGAEAERWLRATNFDLLFLDLDLPGVSGELILEMMKKRALLRPESVVVMSGSIMISATPLADWAELSVTNLLPKPFTAGDVRAIVRRVLTALGRTSGAEPTPVVLGGSGLWSQALGRVLDKSGGRLFSVPRREDIVAEARRLRTPVVVLSSDFLGASMLEVLRGLHAEPALSTTALVIALGSDDGWHIGELLDAGASKVFRVPGEIAELSTTVTRLAGLSRRVHPRAPLNSAVRLSGSQNVLVGTAVDVSVSGLGVKGVQSRPYLEAMNVEFVLPDDDPEPLSAVSDIVWTAPSEDQTHMVGLRFTSLEPRYLERLRDYVAERVN